MKFNDNALRAVFDKAAANIDTADARFRDTHTGLPVDVIIADYPELGPPLQLTETQLHDYAAAVSTGVAYRFILS